MSIFVIVVVILFINKIAQYGYPPPAAGSTPPAPYQTQNYMPYQTATPTTQSATGYSYTSQSADTGSNQYGQPPPPPPPPAPTGSGGYGAATVPPTNTYDQSQNPVAGGTAHQPSGYQQVIP